MMERETWLASLKVGDAVTAKDRYSPVRVQPVRYIDHSRIFYGDVDHPDWVWKSSGYALLETPGQRWIEPAP